MRNEYYMKEYRHFDGDHSVTFNLIEVNEENRTATVVISNQGKITQETINLRERHERLYFEYGVMNEKIYIEDFENIKGDAA
ncbi:MAG: hypothetical protein NC548_40505 [Lachnospiraceae bacterium]|nr:hypothetical protein [Lachnospiraceae bacterium]